MRASRERGQLPSVECRLGDFARRGRVARKRAAVAVCEPLHRGFPGSCADRGQRRAPEPFGEQRVVDDLAHRGRQSIRIGRCQQTGLAVFDQRGRAALADCDHRQPAGLRLEHDLAEGVCAAREQEHVGAGVGPSQVLAVLPAQEGGAVTEPVAQSAPPRGRRRRAPGAGVDPGRAPPGMRQQADRRPSPWSGGRRTGL